MQNKSLIINNAICIKLENQFKNDFDAEFISLNLHTVKQLYNHYFILISPMIVKFDVQDKKNISCYYGLGAHSEVVSSVEEIEIKNQVIFKDCYFYHHKGSINNFDINTILDKIHDGIVKSVIVLTTTDVNNLSYDLYIEVDDVSK